MVKKNKVGAPLGNQNRVALKDPDIRQVAYQSYCKHLSEGKSQKSWYFEHPDYTCTWETFEKYLEDEIEFCPIHRKVAATKGFAHWEQVVADSAIGKNKDANTASLQMIMRNKYSWDKVEKNQVTTVPEVLQASAELLEQVCFAQEALKISDSNHNKE